jgi:hypothetical protein
MSHSHVYPWHTSAYHTLIIQNGCVNMKFYNLSVCVYKFHSLPIPHFLSLSLSLPLSLSLRSSHPICIPLCLPLYCYDRYLCFAFSCLHKYFIIRKGHYNRRIVSMHSCIGLVTSKLLIGNGIKLKNIRNSLII